MNPLDTLPFPVKCEYPGCDSGPLRNAIEVDEHITEEHLAEAVWTFANEQMDHDFEAAALAGTDSRNAPEDPKRGEG